MIIHVTAMARRENGRDMIRIPFMHPPPLRRRRMLLEIRHQDGWVGDSGDSWDIGEHAAAGHGNRVWCQVDG